MVRRGQGGHQSDSVDASVASVVLSSLASVHPFAGDAATILSWQRLFSSILPLLVLQCLAKFAIEAVINPRRVTDVSLLSTVPFGGPTEKFYC